MGIRHRHEMPFGAELVEGGVRFRLWAPAAKSVDLLHLQDGEPQALPMSALPDGWFELITHTATTGSRYKFRIDGGVEVPDPAARANEDIEGASVVVDALKYEWRTETWRGRPWHEAIIYELHVGTFTPEGTFAGVESRLDHLVQLGITVIELMPVADFPGERGWGYDGVLPYAPDAAYGTPDELKSLIDAAHERGLAVMLDVVYNHFGPEGNWLHTYAPQFFTERHQTPWGAGINFDGPQSPTVREFFIHNALYWLEEFQFDGLRVDAVHAMLDDGELHFIQELTQRVHDLAELTTPGARRDVYLVLENGDNKASYLGKPNVRDLSEAQWNDDLHHCLHVILTGESDGYYEDYAEHPHATLCRCLAEGFGYQGDISKHENGRARGEPSTHLPPTAFVDFLQNHDQIGNRALGERLHQLVKDEAALVAATAILLLSPSIPMMFMGEEWAAPEPFSYFCDFGPELAAKVREGRKREFAKFARFAGDHGTDALPDPTDPATFEAAKLNWNTLNQPSHAGWLEHYRRLLAVRQRDIVPLIPDMTSGRCVKVQDNGALAVDWATKGGGLLHLIANLSDTAVPMVGKPSGRVIFATHPNIRGAVKRNMLEPWTVTWLLERGNG
ncbi:MAG TPA: malto-oligosyltrehalose trehalohydrolase [Steroidobacteraceae bacterium]|nr:malto-oligosyltrehalose trehalohydrolase [Steroidobacteraceae bacterium]